MGSRVEQFEQIRRDWDREGLSIRGLAVRHGVHRRTVKQALASPVPPAKRASVSRPAPKLGPYRAVIDGWVAGGSGRPHMVAGLPREQSPSHARRTTASPRLRGSPAARTGRRPPRYGFALNAIVRSCQPDESSCFRSRRPPAIAKRRCDGRDSRSALSAFDRLKSRYLGPGVLGCRPSESQRSRVGCQPSVLGTDSSPGPPLIAGCSVFFDLRLGKPIRAHARVDTGGDAGAAIARACRGIVRREPVNMGHRADARSWRLGVGWASDGRQRGGSAEPKTRSAMRAMARALTVELQRGGGRRERDRGHQVDVSFQRARWCWPGGRIPQAYRAVVAGWVASVAPLFGDALTPLLLPRSGRLISRWLRALVCKPFTAGVGVVLGGLDRRRCSVLGVRPMRSSGSAVAPCVTGVPSLEWAA